MKEDTFCLYTTDQSLKANEEKIRKYSYFCKFDRLKSHLQICIIFYIAKLTIILS